VKDRSLFEIIVKLMDVSVSLDIAGLESIFKNLVNLRHPCISSMIGVVSRSPLQELQIVQQYSSRDSLSEVISALPEWWTPTAKVKTIVGTVLSIRFAHRFGLLHGHLTGDNAVFDNEGLIQICDFCVKSLSEVGGNSDAMAEMGGFSGEG
jgi:serine/threonine protein kinase